MTVETSPNQTIYVGDSGNVIQRIRGHCAGNVESSALRRSIAKARKYGIDTSKRDSGSIRVRIVEPTDGERKVSAYIQSGQWKFILCDSTEKARDFQWYAIEKLNHRLNEDRKPWDKEHEQEYESLLKRLQNSRACTCNELKDETSGPGVYVFCHQKLPTD